MELKAPTILFVCTGNTCRSPMAAALMRRRLERESRPGTVESAGLAAGGEPASPHAAAVMAEWGLDLSGHRSQPVTRGLCERADRIAVMSPRHRAALLALGVPGEKITILAEAEGGIPDPYGGSLADYRETRDALARAVDALPFL